MLDDQDLERWQRNARALGQRVDDAEGVAQAFELLDLVESHVLAGVARLQAGGMSYAYLAAPLGQSPQALRQRIERFWARPVSPAPVLAEHRGRPGVWRWRCRCGSWMHGDRTMAERTAAAHPETCPVRLPRPRSSKTTTVPADELATRRAS